MSLTRRKGLRLQPLERLVSQLIAQGQSNAQIANALAMSLKSVENVLNRLYSLLGLTECDQGGKRVRLAIWWVSRHPTQWCQECPYSNSGVLPVTEQEARPATGVDYFFSSPHPGKALNALRRRESRGTCAALDCVAPVHGAAGKRYCSTRCKERHREGRDQVKIVTCQADECTQIVIPPRRKWCSPQCAHRSWSRRQRRRSVH